MLSIIAAFAALFALMLCAAGALTLNPVALGCGFGAAACFTFAAGWSVKRGAA